MTVVLQPYDASDAAWIDGWLAAVTSSVSYHELARDTPSVVLAKRLDANASDCARIIERDGDAVGVLVYRVDTPASGAAIIELVATPPARSRCGSGMAAAALVETELRAAGVERIYVPAPEVHGIAVYFWIRLGYRPLLRPQWPCQRDGIAWLMRDLT